MAQETSRWLTSKMVPVLTSPKQFLQILYNIAAVVGLIKRDARLTVKNMAHSVGISSGSAHQILTQQLKLEQVCA